MTIDTLKTSISGSFFKMKPEIDQAIDEFRDLHVTVLAPGKGWLYIPRHILTPEDLKWRPLPSELGMSPGQVEDEFLKSVSESDFLYVIDLDGYIGTMVGLEMGYVIGSGVPVYLKEQVKFDGTEEPWFKELIEKLPVASPVDAVKLVDEAREKRGH